MGLMFGRVRIGIFQNMRIKNLRGVSEVRFKKNSTPSRGNVENPPHPQLSAQRAREGKLINYNAVNAWWYKFEKLDRKIIKIGRLSTLSVADAQIMGNYLNV